MDMTPPLSTLSAPDVSTNDASANNYQRNLRDLPREHDFEPLRIEGRLPDDLHGTLYLSGPGLFSSFGQPYRHWFDGDGMMTAIRFDAEGAKGAVRLVMTRQLDEERRAGRMLYTSGATLAPQWRRRIGVRLKNVANTKPLFWNDRLFALFEAGLPTELDPLTLDTIGETDLGGVVQGHLCAHFHEVPGRRAFYNIGLTRSPRSTLYIYETTVDRAMRCIGSIALPRSSVMLHDFIVTDNHLVFFVPPVAMRVLPVLAGLKAPLDALDWRPEQGTTVLIVPIDAPDRYIRFEVDAFFQYHFMNAHEVGRNIVVDFVRFGDFGKAFDFLKVDARSSRPVTEGRLFRAIVDPAKRKLGLEQRWSAPCEFPQVAPAVQARRQRFGYLLSANEGEPPTSFTKFDFTGGTAESATAGESCYPTEAVFVPRSSVVGEDDGYLLSLVYDVESDHSFIAIVDARNLSRGPIARCWFDHVVPPPLHGTWREHG